MAGDPEWERYFLPGTSVLANRYGITDRAELAVVEYATAEAAADEIRTGRHLIERTYDQNHLRAIHRHLFSDLYDWAGHYRTVNIAKSHHGVAQHFGDHNSMDMYMRQMSATISQIKWPALNAADTADALGRIHTRLNFAHPFREGNGRTSRLFLHHVAEQGDYTPDYDRIEANTWITASARTFAHPAGLELDPRPLIDVYHQILTPR